MPAEAARIDTRHLGREVRTLCGQMYARDVVDNDRPDCLPCRIIEAWRGGFSIAHILWAFPDLMAPSEGDRPVDNDERYVNNVLRFGAPSRWPPWARP